MSGQQQYNVINTPSSQNLAELDLWLPPQGAPRVMVPLLIDLRFAREVVALPQLRVEVAARRAKVRLTLSGGEVVRNSRYGDHLNTPYITTEIMESARKILEQEQEASATGEFGIAQGIFGRLSAKLFAKRSKKTAVESDSLVKVAVNAYRIVYRTKDCWDIIEPIPPRILSGKYLGDSYESRDGDRMEPLCFLTFTKNGQTVDIWLSVDRQDLTFSLFDRVKAAKISRNREAVIGELLRRSVPTSAISGPAVLPQIASQEVLLAHSRLEAVNVA